MGLHRIIFFCDDRKVGDCLRALAGKATKVEEVLPVVNVEQHTNGHLKARTNGGAPAMFVDWIREQRLEEVDAKMARRFLESVGKTPSNGTYILGQAVKMRVLKKYGKGSSTKYKVLPPPAERS